MRAVAAAAVVLLAPPPTAADTLGAGSAALGVGMFGDRLATTLDVGLDIERGELAFGLGGRVRWLAGEGVRGTEWDEASEIAAVVRYLTYRRAPTDGAPGIAVAAGALAGVELGHGSVVRGYTTGLDVDHRHLGVQARSAGRRVAIDAVVDDLVSPRIAATRVRIAGPDHVAFAGTLAGDFGTETVVAAIDTDYEAGWATPYVDLVVALGAGMGAHAGVAVAVGGDAARWRAGLEGLAGTADYTPGWFGALYEVERATDAPAADAGFGGTVRAGVDAPSVGRLDVSYALRPGLADRLVASAMAPYGARLQFGAWGAADIARGGERALAAEIRVPLHHGLFAAADAARLYRATDAGYEPLWLVTVAFGSSIGFL